MDDPPKDKEAKKEKEKRRRTVSQARDVSDEELVEREERVWVEVEPPPRTQPYPRSVSAGTGTTDDPFPPRRRKRKQQPPVPPGRRIRTSREDVSQPELSSVDSLSVKKSPRSLRSLSSETQGPSRKLQHSQPSSIRLADSYLDSSDSFGNNSRREESAGRNRDIVIRRVDYDTAEVLKQETPTETQDPSNASVHWRASESSLSGEYHEGFTAGLTGFVVTALAMLLLIMISYFMISQLEFILVMVTEGIRKIQDAMAIFSAEPPSSAKDSLDEAPG